MKIGRWVFREISPQSREPRLCPGCPGVALRRMPGTQGGHDGAVVIVVLIGGPAALEPVEAAIGLLNRPHPVECLATPRMELTGRRRVVHRQRGSRRDD